MTIKLREIRKHTDVYRGVKRLYTEAFPADERAPFRMLVSRAARGRAHFWAAYDKDEFVGFIYVVCRHGLAYLFYFAVKADKRGMGCGSGILRAVKKKYAGKRIFLALEEYDETAPNFEQRRSRAEFYKKNGFAYIPRKIKEASVVYDAMSIGGNISAEEYEALIIGWGGKVMRRITEMRAVEPN